MIHNRHLTRAAAALLQAGASFHVKDAGDPIETLKKAFGEHNTEVLRKLGATDAFLQDLSARMAELEQRAVRVPGGSPAAESWGQQVIRSEHVRSVDSNWRGRLRIGVKATITSATADALGSAGDLVNPMIAPGIIDLPRRKLRLRQLFATGTTSSNAIAWPKLKTRDLNPTTVAEGNMKPQSDLQFEMKAWPVTTLAHWMIASRQILDDAPALRSTIDSELIYGLADVEDAQLLNGTGAGTDLQGVYTGATAFSAPFDVESPTMIDVLLQAIAQCDGLGYEADGIVLNPLDWRSIQAIKDGDGRYIGGGPFSDLVSRLWQMPIVTTTAMSRYNFLVGPYRQGAQIFDREEATVEVSTEDGENFRRSLATLLAEKRLAFVVKHPDAFIKGNFQNELSIP